MLLTRHGVAIQVGPDGFLQLVVRGRLLEAQAQVALQVLVQLVSWKEQAQVNKRATIRANGRFKRGNAFRCKISSNIFNC